MNSQNEGTKMDRREMFTKSGMMGAGVLFAAAAMSKNSFAQAAPGTDFQNDAAKLLDRQLVARNMQRIRVCTTPFADTTLNMHIYRQGDTNVFGSILEMNNAAGEGQATAHIISPENLKNFTGQMELIVPIDGEPSSQTVSFREIIAQLATPDTLHPPIPNDAAAASGCAGCSACSGCVLCLADGPIPDFEVAGIAGLGGLFGLAGSFKAPSTGEF